MAHKRSRPVDAQVEVCDHHDLELFMSDLVAGASSQEKHLVNDIEQ